MDKKLLIIIDGLNGADKTTVAKLLHSKMKRTALLSLDKAKVIQTHNMTPGQIVKIILKDIKQYAYNTN